ncbi:unnamed protein product, partial [Prorocentrum cordatum]
QVLAHQQVTKKEMRSVHKEANLLIETAGEDRIMNDQRTVFNVLEKGGKTQHERIFTYDRIRDDTVFDPRTPKDTNHPHLTAAARKRCQVHLTAGNSMRTSQVLWPAAAAGHPQHGLRCHLVLRERRHGQVAPLDRWRLECGTCGEVKGPVPGNGVEIRGLRGGRRIDERGGSGDGRAGDPTRASLFWQLS